MSACAHAVPAFGCSDCIDSERRSTMSEALKTLPRPRCPLCQGPTEAYDWSAANMTVTFVCQLGYSKEEEGGPLICEGEVNVKVR